MLVLAARHAESTLNRSRVVNGDPSVDVPLTERGREEAALLGQQVANVRLGLCLHTRFGRTLETARIALAGRDVPLATEPGLDDIDVGELEGRGIEDYRAWKRLHRRSDPFPGGESLDEAARRYAAAWARVAEIDAPAVLVVCHEIPLRYLLNGAAGSEELDAPVHDVRNATPYALDGDAVARAAARISELAG